MRLQILRCAVILVLVCGVTVVSGCGNPETPDAVDMQSAPPAGVSTSPSEETVVEFAPAPADASGMQGWLAKAYPNAEWLTRIIKIEYISGEVPDSGGFANAIVLTTSLDFSGEQGLADEMSAALGEAHPAWAKQFVIRYEDGNNITAGDIVDRTP